MKSRLALPLVLLAACGTEPEPKIEYAAVPAIVLEPDQITVSQGEWLEIALISPPSRQHGFVHYNYLKEVENPWIVRCDREPEGWADCDELERAGLVIVGQETYDAIYSDLAGCGIRQCQRAGRAVHAGTQALFRPDPLQDLLG